MTMLQSAMLVGLLCSSMTALMARAETSYLIPGSNGMDSKEQYVQHRRGVYYNGAVYMFSPYHDGDWFSIRVAKLEYDGNGKLSKYTQLSDLVNNNNSYRSYFVAPVVMGGKLFVFYDVREGSGKSWIAMKSSIDPQVGWDQAGNFLSGIKVVRDRPDRAAPFTATAQGNLIFLFYRMAAFDGRQNVLVCSAVTAGGAISESWALDHERGTTDQRVAEPDAMDAKTVLDDGGATCIVLGWLYYNNAYWLSRLYFQPQEGTRRHPPTIDLVQNAVPAMGMAGVDDIHILEACVGQTNDATAANGITVVLANGYGGGGPRDIIIALTQYALNGPHKSTSFMDKIGERTVLLPRDNSSFSCSVCPVLYYYCPPGTRNLVQHLGIVYFQWEALWIGSFMAGWDCPNELFVYKNAFNLDTSSAEKYRALWSLIGVVEGVPPYQADSKEWSTSVSFKQSQDDAFVTSESYAANFSAGMTGGKKNTWSASVQYTYGFKNVYDYSEAVSSELAMNFKSDGDGSEGWFIISQPTIAFNKYARQARNTMVIDPDFIFSYVSAINTTYEPYELEHPPRGMHKRPKSSDFRNWRMAPLNYAMYITNACGGGGKLNTLKASNRTADSSSTLARKITRGSTKSSSHKIKVDLKLGDKNVFMVNFGHESNWEQSVKRSVTIANAVTAAIKCSATNKMITVQPYWFSAPDDEDPPWLPAAFAGAKPWCITWQVNSYLPLDTTNRAVGLDYDGNGTPDIVTTAPVRTGNRTAAAGGLSYGSIYLMSKRGTTLNRVAVTGSSAYGCILDVIRLDNDSFGLLCLDTQSTSATVRTMDGGSTPVAGLVFDETHAYRDHGLFIGDVVHDAILTQNPTNGCLDVHELADDLSVARVQRIFTTDDPNWRYCGVGDFNGDSIADVLVRHDATLAFQMILLGMPDSTGAIPAQVAATLEYLPIDNANDYNGAELAYAGCGDFNGDGCADVLLTTWGAPAVPMVALMNGQNVRRAGYIAGLRRLNVGVDLIGVSDYNADGCADLLLQYNNVGARQRTRFRELLLQGATRPGKFAVRVIRGRGLALGREFEQSGESIYEDLD